MDGISLHPRAPGRATTALRNREVQLVTHKKIGITAIEHAIELTRQLRQTTGFLACDVLIAGYQQTLAQLNGISPTALPPAKLLTLLLLRIILFEDLFILLAQLAALQGRRVPISRFEMDEMSETRDQDPNSDQASRFGSQSHQDREQSASIHSHPRMMRGQPSDT